MTEKMVIDKLLFRRKDYSDWLGDAFLFHYSLCVAVVWREKWLPNTTAGRRKFYFQLVPRCPHPSYLGDIDSDLSNRGQWVPVSIMFLEGLLYSPPPPLEERKKA